MNDGKRGKGPRPGMTQEQRHDEVIQMLRLRQSGASYEAIAKHFGLSTPTVWHRIKRVMDAQPVPEAQYLRDLESMRLDELERRLQPGIEMGDVKAINAARQLSESRRRLMGLDRPQQLEATISRNTEALATQILEEFTADLDEDDGADYLADEEDTEG